MADKIEKVSDATIVAYATAHIAIAKVGGKTFRVKIPANSEHPPVGDAKLKDKWVRRELTKDELSTFEKPESKKEEVKK